MEIVSASGVVIFKCDELSDAVCLADNLSGDLGETYYVRDAGTGEVVYTTGN